MLDIKIKSDCCGCSACIQICPKQCISMNEDNEGFLYPEIEKDICINCGLCEKVCPELYPGIMRKPLKVFAIKNKDEVIRKKCSSGGIFTVLAEAVIREGGVVFGAKFNENWEVVHDYTVTKDGLAAFRGSKYVQSRMGDCFSKAKSFLDQGKKVLFSGTPCQIAGLKRFLRKEYNNLLTVDFICHGVPSPKVWRMYLDETVVRQCEKKAFIEEVSFRDKRLGWKKYSVSLLFSTTIGNGAKNSVLVSEPFTENLFMRGFLYDVYLRPSCYQCPAKCLRSGSEVMIGDLWGMNEILPQLDDDKGYSVLMLNNTDKLFPFVLQDVEYSELNYNDVFRYNPSIEISSKPHPNRSYFFEHFDNGQSLYVIINRTLRKGRYMRFVKRLVGKIIHL